jgi:HPt (histidine-containing phosphotransfer) domain-containing protein
VHIKGPSIMSVGSSDEYQKELIDVFVQEAQEWLQQIHVALDELQQAPPPDRHVKLAHTINAGLTNMGETAATIGLREVERESYAALPFVEAVQSPSDTISARDFVALCRRLGTIHIALTRATGIAFDAIATEVAVDQPPAQAETIPASEILALLHRFKDQQPPAGACSRNLLRSVIAQVEGLKLKGIEQCKVTSLREFLERYSEDEEGFFDAVKAKVPSIADALTSLQSGADSPSPSSQQLGAAVEQAAQLSAAAQQVNAVQTMTFFMGLHSFLTLVMQRRVFVATHSYAAVQARLAESVQALQAWIEAGRAERSAIGGILPN